MFRGCFPDRWRTSWCIAWTVGILLTTSGCYNEWSETYAFDEENAFDTYALHELLSARPEGLRTILDTLDVTAAGNYIFVGQTPYYSQEEVTRLLNFVEEGNVAYIAAYDVPADLLSGLVSNDCYYFLPTDDYAFSTEYVDTVLIDFMDDSSFELPMIGYGRPGSRSVGYLNEAILCDNGLDNEVLARMNNGEPCFIRMGWGDGQFYINTLPIAHTNYYLDHEDAYRYAETTLGRLGPGRVFWDEAVARSPIKPKDDRQAQSRYDADGGRRLLTGNEALRYIQEHRPLAFAWYLLVAAGLAFVIFRGKRRQRIVPEVHRRRNASQRFIDTMSRLLLQKGNHLALAGQELGNLQAFLRDRYKVRWREGEPPPPDLAAQTGMDTEITERALPEIRFVQKKLREHNGNLSEGELMRFFRAINPLYL